MKQKGDEIAKQKTPLFADTRPSVFMDISKKERIEQDTFKEEIVLTLKRSNLVIQSNPSDSEYIDSLKLSQGDRVRVIGDQLRLGELYRWKGWYGEILSESKQGNHMFYRVVFENKDMVT